MPTGPPTAKPGETILSGWGPQSVTKTCLATQFVGPEEHLAAMKLTGSPETKENIKIKQKGIKESYEVLKATVTHFS